MLQPMEMPQSWRSFEDDELSDLGTVPAQFQQSHIVPATAKCRIVYMDERCSSLVLIRFAGWFFVGLKGHQFQPMFSFHLLTTNPACHHGRR